MTTTGGVRALALGNRGLRTNKAIISCLAAYKIAGGSTGKGTSKSQRGGNAVSSAKVSGTSIMNPAPRPAAACGSA